jgi:hypothetical protein
MHRPRASFTCSYLHNVDFHPSFSCFPSVPSITIISVFGPPLSPPQRARCLAPPQVSIFSFYCRLRGLCRHRLPLCTTTHLSVPAFSLPLHSPPPSFFLTSPMQTCLTVTSSLLCLCLCLCLCLHQETHPTYLEDRLLGSCCRPLRPR